MFWKTHYFAEDCTADFMDFKRGKRRYGPKKKSTFKRRDQSVLLRRKPFSTERKTGTTRVFAGAGNGVISSSLVTRMRYAEATISSASTFNHVTFRLNSLYDPNYTITGHQPMGYDQLSTLWNRYRVDRVKVEVSAWCSSATATGQVVLWPSNDLMTLAAVNDLKEQPLAQTFSVPGGGEVVNRTFYYYPYIIMGVTKEAYASDDRHSAAIGSNPTELCALHVAATLFDGTLSNLIGVNFVLTYECTWFDPFSVGGS